MINMMQHTLLEIVEALAHWEDMIDSEEKLSDRFDEYMDEIIEGSEDCVCDYGDDEVAVNEDFANWADGLVSEGELHELQYNAYEYVGKYS